MTEQLYNQDPRQTKFSAKVVSCSYDEKRACYGVILDRTAFFPEGGGQYADPGILGGRKVLDVKERNGDIVHELETALEIGEEVEGQVDFFVRFDRMQQHSGEHIVSGIVHRRFGYENVGFHLGDEVTTLDFNGMLTSGELREIEYEANGAVFANIPVEVTYPSREELAVLEYRSKKELEGQVRIVTIPGYDVCACCAPHVSTTGEIGLIRLVDAVKYKGGVRVTMVCGYRALADYREKEASVREISRSLSAKPKEVTDAVKHLQGELGQWKERMSRFQSHYLEEKLEMITEKTIHYLLFEQELDKNAARRFVDAGMHRMNGICGIFIGTEETGYSYILGSQTVDMKAFLKEFHEVCPGKGGGKPEMVQGSVTASQTEIEEKLCSILQM